VPSTAANGVRRLKIPAARAASSTASNTPRAGAAFKESLCGLLEGREVRHAPHSDLLGELRVIGEVRCQAATRLKSRGLAFCDGTPVQIPRAFGSLLLVGRCLEFSRLAME
jgi:hypothetical protein